MTKHGGNMALNILIVMGVILIVILAIVAGIGVYYNMQSDKMAQNAEFAAGTVGAALPDGKYDGTATVPMGGWTGKVFDAAAATGKNRFLDGSERYPFEVSKSTSIRDSKKAVLKINYNIAGNPLWLRTVTDEIVQVSPNTYLGKIQIQIIPGLPFTAGYFTLKK